MRRSFAYELFDCHKKPWWHPWRLSWAIPHFLHKSYLGQITQYVPTANQVKKHRECMLKFFFSLWNFDGQVIEGNHVVERFRAALIEPEER